MPNLQPRERFDRKTQEVEGCLLWVGATSGRGYGDFWYEGKNVKAHRWVYEQEVGPIPEGLDLDHLCRHVNCVKVSHLEPVSRSENLRRGLPGMTSSVCINGHDRNKHSSPRSDNPRSNRCRACRNEWYARKQQKKWREDRLAKSNTQA